jgi:serine/threonine protein kinase
MRGSLFDFLDTRSSTLNADDKLVICAGVTSGIVALHAAGVAHGDVKAENVLIFDSPHTENAYLAKLTDFGSAIPISNTSSGIYARYYGTPITNAPEVSEQTGTNKLDAIGLIRCDAYSLGLLISQVIIGHLPDSLTVKNSSVLPNAIEIVLNSGLPADTTANISSSLQYLLSVNPAQRCSDISIIENILQPLRVEGLAISEY